MRRHGLGIAGLVTIALLAAGCNSRGGGGTGPGGDRLFNIYGIFVRDANLTSTKDKAYFELYRNDTLFHLAALTVDTFKVDTTAFMTYYRQSPPDYLRPGQNNPVRLVYAPNNLDLTISHFMPDTFSLNFPGLQADHQNPGAGDVQLEWTGSANASGYLIFCSNDTTSLLDTTFFASTGATQATIPQEAFRIGGNVVNGKYNVSIVAFRDALFSSWVSFPIPSGYTVADTIYSSLVSGRIGSAFICKKDTIGIH
jgi:hypothetical protein